MPKKNRDVFVCHPVNPQGQVHPLVLNKRPSIVTWKVSGGFWPQKEFRKGLQSLSQVPEDDARNLIYESAWRKWFSWCGERGINPNSCHLNFAVAFLGQLFEKKIEYSTINTHRSVLSPYDDKVDNQPVDKHPKLCNLTGIQQESNKA